MQESDSTCDNSSSRSTAGVRFESRNGIAIAVRRLTLMTFINRLEASSTARYPFIVLTFM